MILGESTQNHLALVRAGRRAATVKRSEEHAPTPDPPLAGYASRIETMRDNNTGIPGRYTRKGTLNDRRNTRKGIEATQCL